MSIKRLFEKSKLAASLCLLFLSPCFISCGAANLGEDTAEVTPEQKAKKLMNEGKYTEAIEILQPLVDAEPESYPRMPLLAAAYAGSAGIDVISVVTAQVSSSNGDSVFSQLDSVLPSNYEREEVDTMETSVSILEIIPEEKRGSEGDPEYGESADFQLTLYRTLYSTMYLNLFVDIDVNGDIDLDTLANMSDEDAAAILAALRAASRDSSSANGQVIAGSVDDALSEIDATEGETDGERLRNYMANKN